MTRPERLSPEELIDLARRAEDDRMTRNTRMLGFVLTAAGLAVLAALVMWVLIDVWSSVPGARPAACADLTAHECTAWAQEAM